MYVLGGISIGIPHDVRKLALQRLTAEFEHDSDFVVIQLGFASGLVTIEHATLYADRQAYEQVLRGESASGGKDITQRARDALRRTPPVGVGAPVLRALGGPLDGVTRWFRPKSAEFLVAQCLRRLGDHLSDSLQGRRSDSWREVVVIIERKIGPWHLFQPREVSVTVALEWTNSSGVTRERATSDVVDICREIAVIRRGRYRHWEIFRTVFTPEQIPVPSVVSFRPGRASRGRA